MSVLPVLNDIVFGFTVTLNEHDAVPQLLLEFTVTVVVPAGKNVPEFWE